MKKYLKKEIENLLKQDEGTLQEKVEEIEPQNEVLFSIKKGTNKKFNLYAVLVKDNVVVNEQLLYSSINHVDVINKLKVVYGTLFLYPQKSLDEILIITGIKK